MTTSPPSNADLQTLAYNNLNTFFTAHQDAPVEIEILLPCFEPEDGLSMQDGPNIGIPKEILVLAFLEARARFFRALSRNQEDEVHVYSQESLEATRIILLFDPEHLTAANHRKRSLLHNLQNPISTSISPSLLMKRELAFLDSILTSPLHRQSKSPTLWSHRSWLLVHILLPPPSQPRERQQVLQHIVLSELQTVLRSAQRHPKNYYAFYYARRIFDLFLASPPAPSPASLTPSPPSVHSLTSALTTTREWCLAHPADISGWSFLSFLLRRMPDEDEESGGGGRETETKAETQTQTEKANAKAKAKVVERVLDYVVRFRVGNESVWVFVRGVLGEGVLGRDAVGVLLGRLRAVVDGDVDGDGDGEGEGDAVFRKRVRKTIEWVEKRRLEDS